MQGEYFTVLVPVDYTTTESTQILPINGVLRTSLQPAESKFLQEGRGEEHLRSVITEKYLR